MLQPTNDNCVKIEQSPHIERVELIVSSRNERGRESQVPQARSNIHFHLIQAAHELGSEHRRCHHAALLLRLANLRDKAQESADCVISECASKIAHKLGRKCVATTNETNIEQQNEDTLCGRSSLRTHSRATALSDVICASTIIASTIPLLATTETVSKQRAFIESKTDQSSKIAMK